MFRRKYEDILEPRRSELSHLLWISRKIDAVIAYKQNDNPSGRSHKECVLRDLKIQEFLQSVAAEKRIPLNYLETEIRLILDEIGYNKNLTVIRWLGLVLVKICLRVFRGIYVNTDSILHKKSIMGSCPVIFVPSHRSYADFILMSLVCFTYDVEIPAVAAGMDFHGMFGMGSLLRDTGAFFMRRSYNNDSLYWTTFKQYIHQIVTKGNLPIEFFIEGTRSRSNKSLMPKYGLLNMILKPLFLREVPDIFIVPINITYERILEEKLFAFEMLGVPKPKESTSGFFKSLNIIREKFGSVHLTFGEVLSCRKFFGKAFDKSLHTIGPIHRQELSDYDKMLIPPLAHEIIRCQQKSSVLNIFNLMTLLINHNLTIHRELLSLDQLEEKLVWLKVMLESFGTNINSKNMDEEIQESFIVHKNLIFINNKGRVDLVKDHISLTNLNVTKLKGYSLSEQIMTCSVPYIMLYIYINPLLHYLVDAAIIVTILKDNVKISKDDLFKIYDYLRNLLLQEFVVYEQKIASEFESALESCKNLQLINQLQDGSCELGSNTDLKEILITTFQPFLYSYYNTVKILMKINSCDEKNILIEAQKTIVFQMDRKFIHPYTLNLDIISNCLSTLIRLGALNKTKSSTGFSYSVNQSSIGLIKSKLEPHILLFQDGDVIQNDILLHKL